MIQAEQGSLLQSANNLLVKIRQSELEYFLEFFTRFGVQAALLAGFSISTYTNILAEHMDAARVTKMLYWITISMSMGFCIQIVISSMTISVYGGGLALRGPIGSLSKAVDGMKEEQTTILYFYVASVCCFALSTLSSFFLVMRTMPAILTTIIFSIQVCAWYYYCLRIYNRFKYDPIQMKFDTDKRKTETNETFLLIGGYLTREKIGNQNTSRQYVVMTKDDELLCYVTKADWENTLSSSDISVISKINLHDFRLAVKDITGGLYQFRLQANNSSIGDSWELSCDTEDEYKGWIKLLKVACTRKDNDWVDIS